MFIATAGNFTQHYFWLYSCVKAAKLKSYQRKMSPVNNFVSSVIRWQHIKIIPGSLSQVHCFHNNAHIKHYSKILLAMQLDDNALCIINIFMLDYMKNFLANAKNVYTVCHNYGTFLGDFNMLFLEEMAILLQGPHLDKRSLKFLSIQYVSPLCFL